MTSESGLQRDRLRRLIRNHEGLRLSAYRDGNWWAIGYGWRLRDKGLVKALEAGGVVEITEATAEMLLEVGIDEAIFKVEMWLGKVPDGARGAALVDMAYTMSPRSLEGFVRLHSAALVGDWEMAAAEAVDSNWREDVGPRRSQRVYDMLITGLWPAGLGG